MGILNAVISAVSAVGAIGAAWIAWRVYVRQRENDAPVIAADLSPSNIVGTVLYLEVINPSLVTWEIVSLKLLKPTTTLGGALDKVILTDFMGTPQPSTREELLSKMARKIDIGRTVYHAGSTGFRDRPADKSHIRILLFPESVLPVELSMRLNLRSKEARPRDITIPIKRTLNASMIKLED